MSKKKPSTNTLLVRGLSKIIQVVRSLKKVENH